jgi:hypothetical protein
MRFNVFIDNGYLDSADFDIPLSAGDEIWLTIPSAVNRNITDFHLKVNLVVSTNEFEPAKIECEVINKRVLDRF